MGGRGRMLIIAPLEVKCPRAFYLFGGAIINLRPRPPMYYSLNNVSIRQDFTGQTSSGHGRRLLVLSYKTIVTTRAFP